VSVIRRYPASHSQRGPWFLHGLAPDSAAYHAIATWRIKSRLDIGALEKAWAAVAERNESLRTTYRLLDGALMAEVRVRADDLVRVDARGWNPEELIQRVSDEAHRPFDLEEGPVCRAMLFTASPEDHVLLIAAHHVAADGWSNRIAMRELGVLYDAHAAGRPPSLPSPGPSPEEFARWQAEMLAGPEGERLWGFWRRQLAGELPRLDLPLGRPRPLARRHRGAAETIAIEGELAQALRGLARARRTTPFVVLLAAFQALLARYTGQDDIAVGSIAHGRSVPRFRRTLGNLMNQIVLRGDLSGEPSFAYLVGRARQTVRAALAHQAYPFPLLVERLAPVRDQARSALCDVTFGLTYLIGEGEIPLRWDRLALSACPVPRRTSQNDLDVQLVESARGIRAVFQYDADLFEADTIPRMARHYLGLLRSLADDPTARISEAVLLDEPERRALIAGWAHTEVAWDGPARIEALVETQVDRNPEATALSAGARRLSYRALDERANQLAHRLRRLGIGPDVPVAICADRSPDLVVGLLGILKAGGAYVPLDPAQPAARLASALEDAGARALVLESRLEPFFSEPGVPIVSLDGGEASMDGEPTTRLDSADGRSAGDRAYIIYTSGSTGAPKGVEVEHRSVANAVQDVVRRLRLGPTDVWAAITTAASDVASLEVWGALAAGASLELVESSVVADGECLAARVQEAGATILRGTPTLWRLLLASGWSGRPRLKMICGGEPLTRELAEAVLERGAELWNQYGPTEATMYATTEQVTAGADPTIGRPIANMRAYVLDSRGEPVPPGVAGELWIAGVQVARGYRNRPEETDRCFGPDPWHPGHRRYRTGYRVRQRGDGRLEYLGRLDTQVKVRGYRVELEEVESVIASHPAIQVAVVLAPARPCGGGGLTAYIVAKEGEVLPTPQELRAFLQVRLPACMVPTNFVRLPAIPLTPGGKIDRRAVAAAAGTWLEGTMALAPPRTGLEQTLARIWVEVLELERVGIHSDFFELGGDSLLATQIVSRIRETLRVDLALRDLFEAPTVASLAERIAGRIGDDEPGRGPTVEPRRGDGPASLSFSQERMWFLHRLAPDSAAYNVPAALRIRGRLDRAALAAALRDVGRRHEILRTIFPAVEGRPVPLVTERPIELAVLDLRDGPAAAHEARARAILQAEARRPFDLAGGPVVRALLLRLGAEDHVLLLNMHHIVCDQWSFGVLGQELTALYNAHFAGRPSPLPPLPIQFGDYASWQRRWLSEPVLEAQLGFWRRHLGGTLPVLELPTDRSRPAAPTYQGRLETRRLGFALVAGVESLSRREQASVFMTLMAAFNALLARYSGQDDILLGVPIANRNRLASESIVGALVNTLPLRTDLSGDPTFRQLLRRVREALLDAYAHQEIPFDRLVQELQPERYASHSPLVQVLVNFLNAPVSRQGFEGLSWEPFDLDRGAAQFDLTLALDWGSQARLGLEYSTDLFERSTAARMLAHLEAFLAAAVADPDRRLSEIALLAPGECEQVLVTWNRTATPAPGASIHALFEAQADRTPDATAVIGPGPSTYRELEGRANQLAHHLRALGVGPETPVGVCLERSAALFVALLGVLKAGGAFIPLDPGYPPDRLRFMLEDSAAPVLLTDARHAAVGEATGTRTVLLDADWPRIGQESAARPAIPVGSDQLAYVIYTSGSTGTPKGVLGLHGGALNRFGWMWRAYPFRPGEVCCQKTSASFVDSIWEIFGPLLQGVPTVVIPDEVVREPRRLIGMLADHRVTRIVLVPSLLRALLEAEPRLGRRLPHLRLWTSSGEALNRDLVRRFHEARPNAVLLNLYGCSEAAADSTYHEVSEADALGPVPIGHPIDNTEIYILDARREPVPIGVAGEIYIGGLGLARGYLNRPELTAERFLANPFRADAEARMYRTGDRARYRSDGAIEYLGRVDSQVKVRGFRIELGEVEAALATHPDVARAVALVREENTGDRRLVGYVVPRDGARAGDILDSLRRSVPDYMVPSALVLLKALPLTPSGKVDRRALPAPGEARNDAGERPRTATEAELATMWAELLGLPEVGVNDNFFDLGGHSLLAVQLVARIERVFRVMLPLRSLFEAPTVARLAAVLETPPVPALTGHPEVGGERVELAL
jgi:amino acid adenylation domain-containing protein